MMKEDTGAAMIDLETVTAVLEETALTEVMPRFLDLQDEDIRAKSSGELVTVADVAAEQAISRRLLDLIPGSLVVGEEAVDADPTLFDQFASDRPVWIIDPIDGTGNFAAGRPVFALMVALVREAETLAGWIHDPINRRTAVAELGAGAWMAGRRLAVAPAAPPAEMRGTLHASSYGPAELTQQVKTRRERVDAIKTLKCAGWEYLRLALGETQFSLFTRLMPWDHVPGVLIHQEAGGHGRCLDGTPYTALRHREFGVMMAPDKAAWRALHDTLFGD
jgi:fructose-1,6-bisphosphatase/inositol monophosphatase family enzyme